MSDQTGIEWCDSTWNPITGCTEVSPGCDHCYAKTFAERWRGTPGHYFERGFDVQLRRDKIDQPLRWRKPRRIFVNSMSDLFHDDVPDTYIAEVFGVMSLASHHTFQVLTKRHGRMRSLLSSSDVTGHGHSFEAMVRNVHHNFRNNYRLANAALADSVSWPLPNVWMGVSTENQQWADIRIPALLNTPAAVRFISAEPLLGPIELLEHFGSGPAVGGPAALDWVIVGGESGPGARPMHPGWARSLRDECALADVPFLFKQWGEYQPNQRGVRGYSTDRDRFVFLDGSGHIALRDMAESMSGPGFGTTVKRVGKKAAGRVLDDRTWDQYPETATVSA